MEKRPATERVGTPAAQATIVKAVLIGRLETQEQIDEVNAHHDEEAIRDMRESGRGPFTPRTSR